MSEQKRYTMNDLVAMIAETNQRFDALAGQVAGIKIPEVDSIVETVEGRLATRMLDAMKKIQADNAAQLARLPELVQVTVNKALEPLTMAVEERKRQLAEGSEQVSPTVGEEAPPRTIAEAIYRLGHETIGAAIANPEGVAKVLSIFRSGPTPEKVIVDRITEAFKYAGFIRKIEKAAANGDDIEKVAAEFSAKETAQP
jgi:hypothetical protein